jgi:hypothetical protein
MFMHVGGMGDEKTLATAVGKVFAKLNDVSAKADELTADIELLQEAARAAGDLACSVDRPSHSPWLS